jgi:predicted nucleic acid-binding protein
LADHIVNTSPLCYLHRAGILHVLPAMLGRVIVPGQVVAELSAGRARGYDLPEPLVLPWADVRPVAPLSPQLEPFGFLGAGERAVLTLAMANPGSVAIIDELPGRRVAARFGVNVTGTLNVVLVAKQLGHLPAVRPILDRLQELRFRVSAELRDHILTLAGEG